MSDNNDLRKRVVRHRPIKGACYRKKYCRHNTHNNLVFLMPLL